MAKRMAEMRNNVSQGTKDKPTIEKPQESRQILVERLGYRGLEVLQNAETQRPQETKIVIEKLANLIQTDEISEIISGGDLRALFGSLGIQIRMQTKISVETDGKLVPLADKLGAKQITDKDD